MPYALLKRYVCSGLGQTQVKAAQCRAARPALVKASQIDVSF
jgi:hypothetical protein